LEADYYRLAAPQPGKGWVFPLRGYNSRAAGGQNGSGYLAGRYSYWQGNAHGGHPAHDIFILDKDQNCMDDRTGKAVDVLSCTNGIVVATETQWEPGSPQRGGNYVVVFSPEEQRLFYYAHNQNVLVQPGDRVTAGSKLAEVGRTGANAAKKRSPTHLHLMVLKLNNGLPVPDNPWVQLKNARQIP
jgi:murein DD-endopeptidase MepM/ murein hydrolase activator NlpD